MNMQSLADAARAILRRTVTLATLLPLLVAADALATPTAPDPTFTPVFTLAPAVAERLEQGNVRRGQPIEVTVRVPAPPAGSSAMLYLRPVNGEIRSAFGPPAENAELGAELPAVRIPIDRAVPGGATAEIRFSFVPSGRRGSGVEADLLVVGSIAAHARSFLTFAVGADDTVRVRDVRAINAAQREELERDVGKRRRAQVADQVIRLTPAQLRRAAQNDSQKDQVRK